MIFPTVMVSDMAEVGIDIPEVGHIAAEDDYGDVERSILRSDVPNSSKNSGNIGGHSVNDSKSSVTEKYFD